MELIGKLYNYSFGFFYSPIDVPKSLEEVRLSLNSDRKSELKETLTVEAFRTQLLSLVLKQQENQAIQHVLETVVVLEECPSLMREEFMDFSTPYPINSLGRGRSIMHLSNLLNMNRLCFLFQNLSNN